MKSEVPDIASDSVESPVTGLDESVTDPSLRLLAAWVQRGDQEAFATLVHQYGALVRSTCRRVLGSGEDAEDAVQETFIRLARDAASVRSSLGGWLLVCARSVSINLLSSHGARRRREQDVAVEVETMNQIPGTADLDRQDETRHLEEQLTHLRDDERGVIVDYFWFGLSQEEIGRRRGITQVAAKRRLDHAMDSLRRRMGRSAPALGALALCALPAVGSSRESGLVAALRVRGLPPATPVKAAARYMTTSTVAMIAIGLGLAAMTVVVVRNARVHGPVEQLPMSAGQPVVAAPVSRPMPIVSAPVKQVQWESIAMDTTSNKAGHLVADSRPYQVGELLLPRVGSVYEVQFHVEKRHCPFFCVGLLVSDRHGQSPDAFTPETVAKSSAPLWMHDDGNHTLRVTVAPPSQGTAEVIWLVDGAEKVKKQVPEGYLSHISLLVCSGRIEILADSGHQVAVSPVK